MSRELVLRPALWTAAFFNLVGTFLFAFPASRLGQSAGLPADAPAIYRALVALFVLLFGCAYAGLATQPTINRPLVAFGAIGKAAAFFIVVLIWLRRCAGDQRVRDRRRPGARGDLPVVPARPAPDVTLIATRKQRPDACE